MPSRFVSGAAAIVLCLGSHLVAAADVVRNGNTPDRPILSSVEIPAGKALIFVSGMTPSAKNPEAPREQQTLGSMEEQTRSALSKIEAHLKTLGLGMGDIVKAQAFLVADPKTGMVDRDGFNKAFKEFFGTEKQPNKPTRSAFTIAALGSASMFVEIEVMAVRP